MNSAAVATYINSDGKFAEGEAIEKDAFLDVVRTEVFLGGGG